MIPEERPPPSGGRDQRPAPSAVSDQRPPPDAVSDEATLRRWYWLMSELAEIARRVGVSTAGPKLELHERIAARLAGRGIPPPESRPVSRDVLPDELVGGTRLMLGQRCTQQLRAWMTARVGPAFSFDAAMREAVNAGGLTLDELVERWHQTRNRPRGEVAPQFELNRFARAWHAQHDGGTHAEMLAAWQEQRSRPRW